MKKEKIYELMGLLRERDSLECRINMDNGNYDKIKQSLIECIEKKETYNVYGILFDPQKLLDVFPENKLNRELELINKRIEDF